MIISMSDILKGRRSSSKLNAPLRFRMDYHKKIDRFYMRFTLSKDLMDSAGWDAGTFINFVWDSGKRQGFLESATATTGRILTTNKNGTRFTVRYPYVENFELPNPKEAIVASDVKVRKSKVTFYLKEI